MATKEQIDTIMNRFGQARPAQPHQRMDDGNNGMIGVLILLYRSSHIVTAGTVSRVLNISTARVAVLIRKMVEKGLITKETGAEDARVTQLRITEHGRSVIEELQNKRQEQIGRIIDKLGMERIMEYIEISEEMQSVMEPIELDL